MIVPPATPLEALRYLRDLDDDAPLALEDQILFEHDADAALARAYAEHRWTWVRLRNDIDVPACDDAVAGARVWLVDGWYLTTTPRAGVRHVGYVASQRGGTMQVVFDSRGGEPLPWLPSPVFETVYAAAVRVMRRSAR